MQLTRQAEYAVWIMLELSLQPTKGYLAVHEIANRYAIPIAFLQKTARLLLKAGLLEAQRGPHGGLRLKKEPSRVSLLDIITAVEGDIALNPCLRAGARCPRMKACKVREALSRIQEMLARELASHRLDDLAGAEP
ncbi:MAG: Rrf2 family transcriptional regulator [Firmicutes bacterium]|nr:Rrf2 family transcriptional regulator [Bacillota bacterium]